MYVRPNSVSFRSSTVVSSYTSSVFTFFKDDGYCISGHVHSCAASIIFVSCFKMSSNTSANNGSVNSAASSTTASANVVDPSVIFFDLARLTSPGSFKSRSSSHTYGCTCACLCVCTRGTLCAEDALALAAYARGHAKRRASVRARVCTHVRAYVCACQACTNALTCDQETNRQEG
jgi:hypothetical protein